MGYLARWAQQWPKHSWMGAGAATTLASAAVADNSTSLYDVLREQQKPLLPSSSSTKPVTHCACLGRHTFCFSTHCAMSGPGRTSLRCEQCGARYATVDTSRSCMRCKTPGTHGPTNQSAHQPNLVPVAAHVRHSICLVTLGSDEGAFSTLRMYMLGIHTCRVIVSIS